MTLHITFASNRYVLQLSDRLVSLPSRGSLTKFDETANKTVIYVARDAYVSIGYTGLAYIDGRPTDQWIAEKLIGEEVGSRRGPSGGIAARLTAGGNIPWYDIGTARRVLRSELFALSLRVGETMKPHLPTLVMAGWQRRKRFSRPIAHVLTHDVLNDAAHSLPRDFWWRDRFQLSALPSLPVLHSKLNELRTELKKIRCQMKPKYSWLKS
jgi:hypothetical protein